MPWYAAHTIMRVKLKEHQQDQYPIWENVILIEANSDDEALSKAQERGKEDEIQSDDFTWEGHPAILTFEGVRKIIDCQEKNDFPRDGTEITYSQMLVASEEALLQLVEGKSIIVQYDE